MARGRRKEKGLTVDPAAGLVVGINRGDGDMKMTLEEFIEACKTGGIETAKKLLGDYIKADQPDGFVPEYTSRAMCREASNAITGDDDDYGGSKHGIDLYIYMWHGEINN